jgi:hypothetical protein
MEEKRNNREVVWEKWLKEINVFEYIGLDNSMMLKWNWNWVESLGMESLRLL